MIQSGVFFMGNSVCEHVFLDVGTSLDRLYFSLPHILRPLLPPSRLQYGTAYAGRVQVQVQVVFLKSVSAVLDIHTFVVILRNYFLIFLLFFSL